eukprot:5279554-Amphidinium_carterae.1
MRLRKYHQKAHQLQGDLEASLQECIDFYEFACAHILSSEKLTREQRRSRNGPYTEVPLQMLLALKSQALTVHSDVNSQNSGGEWCKESEG